MASSWGLSEGDEIAPGRTTVTRLGGGHRYEVYLAFDGRLRALVVAKLVRPDQVGSEGAQRALASEQRLLDRLAHPMLRAPSAPTSRARIRSCCSSTSRARACPP